MISYLTKDVTTVERGIIAHGCNCSRGFGSGVAGAIRKKWPQVYESFITAPYGKTMLGTAHLINISPERDDTLFVANCYTQQFYGSDGGRYADIDAVETCLTHVYNFADVYDLDVYMPQIGCGLGGLNWKKEVEPIVTELCAKWDRINTYVCTI